MRFLRVGICVLLAFSVLAFGGVEEWAQAGIEVGAAVLLAYWAIQEYRLGSEQVQIPSLFLPLAAFALVVLVQLVFRLTASRYHTRVEFQLLLAYLIVVFLLSQAYQKPAHWRGFVWFLMVLGFCVSIFGILQYLTYNGQLYWFRTLRYGGYPFGPYVNRNHFAGFAELLIPVALVPLVLGKVRRERLFLVSLFALIPMVALLLSASRGGIVSFAMEMVILFVLLLLRKLHSRYLMAGGVLVLSALLAVSWIGIQQVLTRFSNTQILEVTLGKRASMRHDTWKIFLDHPVLGTGLGTIQMVFPAYETNFDNKVVNHSHNDYLEALAETGVVGGLCCMWFLGVFYIDAVKGLSDLETSFGATLNLAGLVACSGILVHSLVDFNLHTPANALLFFVAAHLATTRLQAPAPSTADGSSRRRRHRKPEVGRT